MVQPIANKVRETQLHDQWSMGEIWNDKITGLCRWRTPVLAPPDVNGYDRVLKVVWIYADENTGAMPSYEQSEQMSVFENRLCAAWEHDGHAYLAAVLTFDGARQWVFYTFDVPECGRRLHGMPQEAERYPIELITELDPEWSWLRHQILKRFLKKQADE